MGFQKKILNLAAFSICFVFLFASPCYSLLTAGEQYTIEIDAISSTGTTVDLGISASAVADSNGKISFNIQGIPDRTSYNFLLVTIKDPTGATVRRSLAPAPSSGSSTNLGVSLVTDDQAEALISAMQTAGSDNPIMVAFGMVILRTAALDSTNLARVATAARGAVTGFETELTSLGVTASQLVTFKSGIVSRLGQFTSLYKDAVDAATDAAAAQNRGKAAGLLMQILVNSATDAGFREDYVELAMMAAGDAVDNDASWASLPSSFRNAVDAEMSSAIMKMRAEKSLKKYTDALTTLGASSSQLSRFNTAANTLFTSMENAFKTFEVLFQDEDNMPADADITAAQTAINTAMQTAFDTFITDSASTGTEIDTMATAMKNGFCGVNAGCITMITTMRGTNANNTMFSFRKQDATAVYWPIPMAVPTTWTSNIVAAGGSLTYTRDTLAVPAMLSWLNSEDWEVDVTPNLKRHDFGDVGAGGPGNDLGNEAGANTVAGDDMAIPASLAALNGLREDIQIIEFTKYSDFQAGGGNPTMTQMKTIMNNFNTRLAERESALSGTTDGATSISTTQKKALITTSLSPDFD
ncbi:MAG: hypothetical protein Q8N09_04975 [Thermodesulfovibrionia bacterium]|nr:hypothetical protein [Thermodesulfovibrionia bacterium]